LEDTVYVLPYLDIYPMKISLLILNYSATLLKLDSESVKGSSI